MKFDRWTKYPGGVYDNRPTKVLDPIETHATDGFNLRHADNILLENCAVIWKQSGDADFRDAINAGQVRGLKLFDFTGDSSVHPIVIH